MSTAATAPSPRPLDPQQVRADFPVLDQEVQGHPLAYLDNAATSQKPARVIEVMDRYYRQDNANIHRGVHTLSERATAAYEGARERIARFINAPSSREIIFLRGTTEAINLVANSWARPRLQSGDRVLVTELEHHSNIVPWQLVCEATGAELRVVPVTDAGELDQEAWQRELEGKPAIVALGHVSNALGTINPLETMIPQAKAAGATVVVDGAQATPHLQVDVRALGCDFYAFSGHKMFGPTGIGCLWGHSEHLEAMPPWQGGGEMIKVVRFDKCIWNDVPHKFEAGTPNIAGAIGLGEAVAYIEELGIDRIAEREAMLLDHATRVLSDVPGLRIYGTGDHKAAVVSFTLEDVHPHDLGTILDHEGVAIRAGHHCAMPLMERFGVAATTRASMAMYNTTEEIDRLAQALRTAREVLS